MGINQSDLGTLKNIDDFTQVSFGKMNPYSFENQSLKEVDAANSPSAGTVKPLETPKAVKSLPTDKTAKPHQDDASPDDTISVRAEIKSSAKRIASAIWRKHFNSAANEEKLEDIKKAYAKIKNATSQAKEALQNKDRRDYLKCGLISAFSQAPGRAQRLATNVIDYFKSIPQYSDLSHDAPAEAKEFNTKASAKAAAKPEQAPKVRIGGDLSGQADQVYKNVAALEQALGQGTANRYSALADGGLELTVDPTFDLQRLSKIGIDHQDAMAKARFAQDGKSISVRLEVSDMNAVKRNRQSQASKQAHSLKL